MSSRDKILAAVAQNQPAFTVLPDISILNKPVTDLLVKFTDTLTAIGGKVIEVSSYEDVADYIKTFATETDRVISKLPELKEVAEMIRADSISPHLYADVEFAVINAHFGVAENGAVWVTEKLMGLRVLPFICQHLIIVLPAERIVPNMHEAYEKIGSEKYEFGTFIAGPSKTADIEQSLVLGAHGPRTMTVFLLKTAHQ